MSDLSTTAGERCSAESAENRRPLNLIRVMPAQGADLVRCISVHVLRRHRQRLLLVDGYGVMLPEDGSGPLNTFFTERGLGRAVDDELFRKLTMEHLDGRRHRPFPPGETFSSVEAREQMQALRAWVLRTGAPSASVEQEAQRAYRALQLYLHGEPGRLGYYDSVVAKDGA